MEDRYTSAAGWQPRDPYKKQREKARREYKSKPQPGQSMLEIRPASHWIIAPSQQKPRPELYGPMWLKGDVCLLFGTKGVGKSVFAVQLAEDIATGSRSLTDLSEPGTTVTGVLNAPANPLTPIQDRRSKMQDQKVLLIDFEQTTAQFTERYTYPSPIPGKLPCRTRFHFRRASIGDFGPIPECFKGRIHDYLQYSISAAIRDSEAEVVILDSINYLFRGPITAATMTNVLKSLKLYAHMYNVSILATATTGAQASLAARKTKNGAQASLPSRYAHELNLATLADSAIILAPSTYGPQYRYTKLLSTRNQVPETIAPTSPEVLTYELNSATTQPRIFATLPAAVNFETPQLRNSATPFLFLGPSNEQDHLRNYAAEAEAATQAQEKAIKRLARRSSKQAVVDGVLDGSFRRYLLGE